MCKFGSQNAMRARWETYLFFCLALPNLFVVAATHIQDQQNQRQSTNK